MCSKGINKFVLNKCNRFPKEDTQKDGSKIWCNNHNTPTISFSAIVNDSLSDTVIVDVANVLHGDRKYFKRGREDEEADRSLLLEKYEKLYNDVLRHFGLIKLVFHYKYPYCTNVSLKQEQYSHIQLDDLVKTLPIMFKPYTDENGKEHNLFKEIDPEETDSIVIASHFLRVNKYLTDENWEECYMYIDADEQKKNHIADFNLKKETVRKLCIKGIIENFGTNWARHYPQLEKERKEYHDNYTKDSDHIPDHEIIPYSMKWIYEFNKEHNIKNVLMYNADKYIDDDALIGKLSEEVFKNQNPQQFKLEEAKYHKLEEAEDTEEEDYEIEDPKALKLPVVISSDIDAYFYNPHAYILKFDDKSKTSFTIRYSKQVLYEWGFPHIMLNQRSLIAFLDLNGSDHTKRHIGKAQFDISYYRCALFKEIVTDVHNMQKAKNVMCELRETGKLSGRMLEMYCKDNDLPISHDPFKIVTSLMNETTNIILKCVIQCRTIPLDAYCCEQVSEAQVNRLFSHYSELFAEYEKIKLKAKPKSPKKEETVKDDVFFDSFESDGIADLTKVPPKEKTEEEKPAQKPLVEESQDSFDLDFLSDDQKSKPAEKKPAKNTEEKKPIKTKEPSKQNVTVEPKKPVKPSPQFEPSSSGFNLDFDNSDDDKITPSPQKKADNSKSQKAGAVIQMSDEEYSSDIGVDMPKNKPVAVTPNKKDIKPSSSINEPSGSFNMDLSDLSTGSKPATKPVSKQAPIISETSDINVDLGFSDDSLPPKPKSPPKEASKPAKQAPKQESDDDDVSINFDDDDFNL